MLYTVDMIEKLVLDDLNRTKTMKFDVIGLILHIQSIRLVGWKEEEILSLSNGKDSLLDVSFWKTHDEPKGLNMVNCDGLKGRVIIIKNVTISHSPELREDRLQLFGKIMNGAFQKRHILILDTNDFDVGKFEKENKPFQIDTTNSIIPDYVKGKPAGKAFPLLPHDCKLMRQVLTHYKWYKKCCKIGVTGISTYLTRTLARRGVLKLKTETQSKNETNEITEAMMRLNLQSH